MTCHAGHAKPPPEWAILSQPKTVPRNGSGAFIGLEKRLDWIIGADAHIQDMADIIFEFQRLYSERRAGDFRREAQECPEGSEARRDALYLAFRHEERAERLGRIERVRRGIFPAAIDEEETP